MSSVDNRVWLLFNLNWYTESVTRHLSFNALAVQMMPSARGVGRRHCFENILKVCSKHSHLYHATTLCFIASVVIFCEYLLICSTDRDRLAATACSYCAAPFVTGTYIQNKTKLHDWVDDAQCTTASTKTDGKGRWLLSWQKRCLKKTKSEKKEQFSDDLISFIVLGSRIQESSESCLKEERSVSDQCARLTRERLPSN